jgi:amino acid adenylation domain-containing protein
MKITVSKNQEIFAPPVSYSQERLWFLEQLEPNTAIYNIPYMATVKGAVHRAAFNRAVNRLIARHESLRTYFVKIAGAPRQAILAELSVEVDWQDLRDLDARDYAEKLQAICTEVTSTPFDMGSAPLFRIMLVATPRETTIITTIHHIISDGWSIGIFQRDLVALYQEELGGRPATLPALPIQYADYAVRQRERLDGDGLERLKRYWVPQLSGVATILEIPADHRRPLKQSFTGDVHMFDLGPQLTADIRALSAQQDATLFMALLATFTVLLYRLTAQDDILVGTPIAGRTSVETENLVGLFVNTLVLRTRLEPELSFVQLLSQVTKTTLEAFQHQDMPFEKLVLELNPKRDLSHSPLVQVLFSLQNIPPLQALIASGGQADGELSQNLNGHTGTAKFDFALFVSEVGDRLQCSIEFNTDLFARTSIVAIGEYFSALLNEVTKNPAARIASYPLLTAGQRQRCLESGRGARKVFSEGSACHHLFERACLSHPDAVAVVHASRDASQGMSYAELNGFANRIARHLESHGVRAGDNVAICLPRGIDQVAAVMGIMKAGAAYVPLDPDYPAERLQFILDDIQARLLLCASTIRGLRSAVKTVILQRDAAMIEAQPSANRDIPHSPDMPLYIIYTSGSTGRPKGVVMPHRALVNLVEWQSRASGGWPGAVTLQYAPLHFDVASQEIFATLTSGGCLLLIDDDTRRDSPRLLDFLRSHEVSRLFLPPVALEQLAIAASDQGVVLGKLREVIVAGDKLQVTDQVRSLFEKAPQARLINQYGPTESHVVSAYILQGPPAQWSALPPIGRPIDNVGLYVLDDALEPVPPKVTGELYIGGVAVALGYHNLPKESAERFVKSPFPDKIERLYRTGDVCRYDNNGILEFVGRADQQIKLRGFRIEPAEVEAALKATRGVKNAVVAKRRSRERGEDQLVAYLVLEETAKVTNAELRDQLGDKLPTYMIPTHFVRMAEFPLTGSGKIARRALPDPQEQEPSDAESNYLAPRTAIEQFLAECWCNLLKAERVSIRDNFFDLGGHSLSATQLVSRIRDRFGLELALYSVFERPTIELLALEIIQRQALQEEPSDLEAVLNELESLSEEHLQELLSATETPQLGLTALKPEAGAST